MGEESRRNDRWSLLLPAMRVSERSGGESGLLGVTIVEKRGQRREELCKEQELYSSVNH